MSSSAVFIITLLGSLCTLPLLLQLLLPCVFCMRKHVCIDGKIWSAQPLNTKAFTFHSWAPPASVLIFFLLCSKIGYVFFKSNCTDMNETIIYSFCENLKSNGSYLLHQVDIWTCPSFGGHLEFFFEIFCFMTILVMPHILESWQLCHNMLYG